MVKDMTTGPAWKHILFFSLPLMAGNFLQQLYNAVDGIIVGQFVSAEAFSSVGLNLSLTMLFIAFAIGLGVGIAVVVAQYFGAQRMDDLLRAIDTALIIMGVIGAVLTAVGITCSGWLLKTILQVPEELLYMSKLYFSIYCTGLFFQFMYNGIAAVLRGVGDSRSTLYFLMVSAIMNIVLDLLFVAVIKLSVAGAAIATVISQAACFIVSYIYLRRRFASARGKKFDKQIGLVILKLGLPSALQQSIVALGNIAIQRLVNGFGQASIGGYAAANRIDGFMFIPISSFQMSLASYTGQNVGAGRMDRIKSGLVSTCAMSMSVVIVIGILLYVFAAPAVSFFGMSGEGLRRGVEQVRFLAPCYIIFSIYLSTGGVLQGAGDTLMFSAATLGALGTRVFGSYVTVALGWLGYSSPWVCTPIGWSVALIIVLTRYFTGGWKNKAVVKKAAKEGEEL